MPTYGFSTPMNGRAQSELPPKGSTKAIVNKLVDIGTNLNTRFEPSRQIVIGWILYGKDNKPMIRSNGYYQEVYSFCPWTLGKAAGNPSRLRRIVEGLIRDELPFTGDRYDLTEILGLGAMVNLTYGTSSTGKPFATFRTMNPLFSNDDLPDLPEPPKAFLISENHCEIPDWIPVFLVTIIQRSAEWQGLAIPPRKPKMKQSFGNRPFRQSATENEGRESLPSDSGKSNGFVASTEENEEAEDDYGHTEDIPF